MPRRRSETEVTMFPFLSVLCTVIGVLILFVVLVLSTRVVEEEERYLATEAHERQIKPGTREDVFEQGIGEQAYKDLELERQQLSEQLEERKTQRDSLVQKLDGLEDLLEFKKTELLVPVTSQTLREFIKPEPIAMVPDESYIAMRTLQWHVAAKPEQRLTSTV